MATTPFMMGPAERAKLAELRDRAARDPVDMADVVAKLNTDPTYKARHVQRMTRLSVLLPFRFIVTFSIERNHPSGTMRHMSMSSPVIGRLPAPSAVWMAAEALGFVGSLDNCMIWIEHLRQGEAVNAVQPLELTAAAERERLH